MVETRTADEAADPKDVEVNDPEAAEADNVPPPLNRAKSSKPSLKKKVLVGAAALGRIFKKPSIPVKPYYDILLDTSAIKPITPWTWAWVVFCVLVGIYGIITIVLFCMCFQPHRAIAAWPLAIANKTTHNGLCSEEGVPVSFPFSYYFIDHRWLASSLGTGVVFLLCFGCVYYGFGEVIGGLINYKHDRDRRLAVEVKYGAADASDGSTANDDAILAEIRKGRRRRHSLVKDFVQAEQAIQERLHAIMRELHGDRPGLKVSFDKLDLVVPKVGLVLAEVSGVMRPGESMAVMGPSGCGKSTLFDILRGKLEPAAGTVAYQYGDKLLPQRHLRKLIGFVPQADIMFESLTCKETLMLCARTRLPADKVYLADDYVDALLDVLELGTIQNLTHAVVGGETIRGLSGGQKKRLSVGMELAADPCLIFLDEPTSGLDSRNALRLMALVQEIARQHNVTAVSVIHQPSWRTCLSFDKLLVLSTRPGRVVYNGPMKQVVPHFKSTWPNMDPPFEPEDNPADVLLDVVSMYGSEMAARWLKHTGGQSEPGKDGGSAAAAPSPPPLDLGEMSTFERVGNLLGGVRSTSGVVKQTWWLWQRSTILIIRKGVMPQVLLFVMLSVMQGLLYSEPLADKRDFLGLHGDYTQAIILVVLVNIVLSILFSLELLGGERVIFWRESKHFSIFAYLLAKNLACLPLTFFCAFAYTIFWYQQVQPHIDFGRLYLILLLLQWASEGWGQFISLVANANRQLAGGGIALVLSILSGAFPPLATLPPIVTVISMLTVSRWAVIYIFTYEYAPWLNGQPRFPDSPSPPYLWWQLETINTELPTCRCMCGFPGFPHVVPPGTFCNVSWQEIPYCGAFPQDSPWDGNAMTTPWVPNSTINAAWSCLELTKFGYPLPLDADLDASVGAREPITMLIIYGLAMRFLTFIALHVLDIDKRL